METAIPQLESPLDKLPRELAKETPGEGPWPVTFLTSQVGQQGDGLDGLAEPHFVSQDAVELLFVHGNQPVQPNVLVLPQLAPQEQGDGCLHLTGRTKCHGGTEAPVTEDQDSQGLGKQLRGPGIPGWWPTYNLWAGGFRQQQQCQ